MKTLESLKELACRANSGTSFSPEKRGESIVNSYSEELDSDIEKMKESGVSDEKIETYKSLYIANLTSWLNAKSRCISSMITGPSNFPVRRAEKANNSENNKYNEFRRYRENVFKGIEIREKKKQIEEAGGELGVAKKKLEQLEEAHEYMKSINKAYKAYKKNPQSLIESVLSEKSQEFIIQFVPTYSFEPLPFPSYSIANSNARIKNTKQRVAELESKEEKASSGEDQEIKIKGGVCVIDYKMDRIKIVHDEKPERAIIDEIKSHGFNWSPFYKVWMRKITNNSLYVTKNLLLPKLS